MRDDLDAFREFRDTRDTALVFPGGDGNPWARTTANIWRGRVWKPVLKSLATEETLERLETAVPTTAAGHSSAFTSARARAHWRLRPWAGHSPQVMFQHYAHVIEELVGEPRLSSPSSAGTAPIAGRVPSASGIALHQISACERRR